jgi:hypothetical protein
MDQTQAYRIADEYGGVKDTSDRLGVANPVFARDHLARGTSVR